MKLAKAKKRIRARHCTVGSVGSVRGARSTRVGRVIGQRPKAGAVKRQGFPVKLIVGRR
jgi:beta-lactam-binding protein with PASTA domain